MTTTTEIGAAGARRAAALLGIAVCAEVSNASFAEDAAKVDLHLTFRNAFKGSQLTPFHCQVKSGKSFRGAGSPTHIALQNIGAKTIDALSGKGTPGLIVWVPPRPLTRMYWYVRDPRNSNKEKIRVHRLDYVRPSLRYDLSRLAIYATWRPRHATQTVKAVQGDKLLGIAKKAYARLKVASIDHPLVGSLKATRLAWRHVTRRSKPKPRRDEALRIVPYLGKFLSKAPDRFLCEKTQPAQVGSRMVETRYLLCWYRDALSIDDEQYTLVVRIREEISFPAKWESEPLPITDIHQEATLASWWCKKQK